MAKPKMTRITPELKDTIEEGLGYLAPLLARMGLTELRISKKKMEVFWDIDNAKSKLDHQGLGEFFDEIERRFHDQNERLGQG